MPDTTTPQAGLIQRLEGLVYVAPISAFASAWAADRGHYTVAAILYVATILLCVPALKARTPSSQTTEGVE